MLPIKKKKKSLFKKSEVRLAPEINFARREMGRWVGKGSLSLSKKSH